MDEDEEIDKERQLLIQEIVLLLKYRKRSLREQVLYWLQFTLLVLAIVLICVTLVYR